MIVDDFHPPGDWTLLLWHRDPVSKRYRTRKTCWRAAVWLNAHEGVHDCWEYRPGPVDRDGGVRFERRWIGRWHGLVGEHELEAGNP